MTEKKVRSATGLFSVLIAVCVSFGGICCMVTAFKFPTDGLLLLLLFCIGFALLMTRLMRGKKKGILLLYLAVAIVLALIYSAVMILYLEKPAWASLEALFYRLAHTYDTAYGFGITDDWNRPAANVSLYPGLCVIAGFIILMQVWTIVQRKNSILAVVYALFPLFTCLVVTDTVPAAWAIFLLLTPLVLLILTQTVRRRDERDGNRLTALLLIPCCLLNVLLLRAVPREDYKVNNGSVGEILSDWFWALPFLPDLPGNGSLPGISGVVDGLEVDLQSLGPNYQSEIFVMNVTAPRSELLYLRGQAYDVYTGTAWQVKADLEGETLGWPTEHMSWVGQLKIETRGRFGLQYFPYYVLGGQWLENYKNGAMANDDLLRAYTYDMADLAGNFPLRQEDRLTDALYEHYQQLPESTKQKATVILSGVDAYFEELSVEEKAQAIARYVSQTATYDLMTQRMPSGQTDFAIWFLEQGQTGYCVHFASAATVLLRAAGIPARYVTGYMTYPAANVEHEVTAKQAHAWVEYYEPTLGWQILEPTPGEAQPLPPTETEPSDTTDPSETTEPSESTRPEDTTTQTRPTQGEESESTNSTGGGGGQSEKPDRTWLLRLLKVLGGICAAVAAVWLQYVLRRNRRYKKMRTGPMNGRAIARWREVRRFGRILKETPPEALEELAEKAKFSQHKMTMEELKEFDHWLRQALARLKEKKFSWLIRLIWAV